MSDPASTAVTVAKPVLEDLWAFLRKKIFAKADREAIDSAFREILSVHPDEERIASLLGVVKDTNREEYRRAVRASRTVHRKAMKRPTTKKAKMGRSVAGGTRRKSAKRKAVRAKKRKR